MVKLTLAAKLVYERLLTHTAKLAYKRFANTHSEATLVTKQDACGVASI